MIEIDWKAEAVKELRNYKFNVQGVKNLRERIEILDAQLEGIRSPGSTEGAGSGRERDETYCDVITKRDNMRRRLDIIEREIQLIDKALSALSQPERDALVIRYINSEYNSIGHICSALHVERTKAYSICAGALQHFSAALFGLSAEK